MTRLEQEIVKFLEQSDEISLLWNKAVSGVWDYYYPAKREEAMKKVWTIRFFADEIRDYVWDYFTNVSLMRHFLILAFEDIDWESIANILRGETND